ALVGARLIAESLPRVVEAPHDEAARRKLLSGASHGGEVLSLVGLGIAHAMAQALGGTYGLPHGAMNALCLAPGLRFAAAQAPDAVRRFERALGGRTVEELALLGGFRRLRDFDVPEADLAAVAATAAGRPGNLNMPTPATPDEIEALFRSIW